MPIEIRPYDKPLGAEISGINLSKDLSGATFKEVYQAFIDYKVLIFREQDITPQNHLEISQRFGPLERLYAEDQRVEGFPDIAILSNEVVDGKHIGVVAAGDFWHSDISYREETSLATFLYGLKIPNIGGDTEFADMQNGYNTLSEEIKGRIKNLKGIHQASKLGNKRVEVTRPGAVEYYKKQSTIENICHPLVRTHPISGRLGLYLSPRFTIGIEGMDETNADPLLDLLFNHVTEEKNIYQHKWRLGDFVLWDNRCVNHRACGGYGVDDIRLLHRTSTKGDKPYFNGG